MTLSDILAEQLAGKVHPRSTVGRIIRGKGVQQTPEFKRIRDLPRRDWTKEDLSELSSLLEWFLLLPDGDRPCGPDCACPRSLWPVQAVALRDACEIRGLLGSIGVGRGKALISLLTPTLLEAKRPVLLVPAALREQTLRKVLPSYRRHWRILENLRVVAYSELSLAKNAKLLEELAPDLIVMDEAHSVKNPRAGRTRRLRRYLDANPRTQVVAMSGTITRKSILDYWAILLWTHKSDLAPLPVSWTEVSEWSLALDEGIDESQRIEPGALGTLPRKTWETVREGYQRRLVETPGVVATGESDLGVSLRISERHLEVPGNVETHLRRLRNLWETPNGAAISEAVDLWRHARQLAIGFFYRWDPPAPAEWLDARKEWKRYVRETITHNRRGLDTELQVARECATTRPVPEWESWRAIRDTFKPNPVPEWIDDFALRDASKWLSKGEGIVWVDAVAFGERLAEVSGFPYFGAGARASREILDATGPIIASISAHGEGKNLQRYSRNLVVAPPSSGKSWEQLLGRTHRAGQLADEVEVDVYLHTEELTKSFLSAKGDAQYLEETLGGRQKLLYADDTTGRTGS